MKRDANPGAAKQEANMARPSFIAPLVLPVLTVAPEPFKVGDVVANFGQIARVTGVRPDGLLEVQDAGTLDRPLTGAPQRWLANPDFCRPVR